MTTEAWCRLEEGKRRRYIKSLGVLSTWRLELTVGCNRVRTCEEWGRSLVAEVSEIWSIRWFHDGVERIEGDDGVA